jgi:hypothetical protein
MSNFNTAFAGRHVTVLSGVAGAQERTDTGTLVDMDGNWIQLAKDNGEMLLFPFTSVRVIKLLDVEPPYVAEKRDLRTEPLPPPRPAVVP